MSESATRVDAPDAEHPDLGTRERRRLETSRTLISLARRATAEHGLHGFTVDELCAQVDISRRTFFNYFASKEDAVLGLPLHADSTAADDRFVARGRGDGTVSPTLLADLAELMHARWAMLGIHRDTLGEMIAATEREPRLVAHMLERSREEEQQLIALVERREGLAPGDLRAAAAATIVGHLSRTAAGAYLDPDSTDTYATHFDRLLQAARDVFMTTATQEGSR